MCDMVPLCAACDLCTLSKEAVEHNKKYYCQECYHQIKALERMAQRPASPYHEPVNQYGGLIGIGFLTLLVLLLLLFIGSVTLAIIEGSKL
jgi:hypothetical protein